MQPWSRALAGRLDELTIDSRALEGNRLGDPSTRPLWVYVPPSYDAEAAAFPAVYVLQGYTGQLDMWRNRVAFRPTALELIDELFATAEAPPCIIVFVDAWTSVGGSQFVDSPGTGRYHTYLCEEVVSFVDDRYRTLADRDHRGLSGKSSGGYGAVLTALLRPDLFSAVASHAGGGLFDVTIRPFFRDAVRALREHYQGSFERFWEDFRGRPAFSRDHDIHLTLQYGFAAAYSADDDGTVRLPYDLVTAEIVPERWERWLQWDTVRMAPTHADALRSLRGIYLDAGRNDEWFVDLAATAFAREAERLGGSDVRFELFDATHAFIEYRYPLGVRYLAERLSPSSTAG